MVRILGIIFLGLAAVTALPNKIRKIEDDPRYQYVQGPDGNANFVDTWLTSSDFAGSAEFDPDRQIIYHLFTRQNPVDSQRLMADADGLLGLTNYNPARRTVVLLHGWLLNVNAHLNKVLVPAFLQAEDVNVIVVDWSAGADTMNYIAAVDNTVTAGLSVAKFITWLIAASGAVLRMFHIVGHSLGGQLAGIIGRNLGGEVAYITALDPALPGWAVSNNTFRNTDGVYTEVIHTTAGILGYKAPIGDVDFYPNGGINMPGCDDLDCNHVRPFLYLGESLTSGGFTGRRCASYVTAMAGNCSLWGSLKMGGLLPKTGSSGIFYLETNASPPFSRDTIVN